MILTVTFNSALDRILFIEEFRSGTTMRPFKMIESVGGKGFDTSVVLCHLGVDTLALGFVAGHTGRQLAGLLDGYGLRHDLVWVEGETRTSHVIIETRPRQTSHIIAASLSIVETAYQTLLQKYQAHLPQAAWVVGGGTLPVGVPPDSYRRLIEVARLANVPVLLDISGTPALAAMPARPDILKMNRDEFTQTFGLTTKTLDELKSVACQICERERLPALVLTCGSEGILAFTPVGLFLARSPAQTIVNTAGAGDAASAALAWRLSLGDNWPEALRWAAATGAAVVLTEGTADCHPADIERILAKTELVAI